MPGAGRAVTGLFEVADYSLTDGRELRVSVPLLRLRKGAVVALFGPSGCGKTSLLLAWFGLLQRPGWTSEGSVTFAGREFRSLDVEQQRVLRWGQLAFLMQDALHALDPLVPVGEQIRAATDASADEIVAALQRLGVDEAAELMQREPHRISGGQAQRALLAIAFLRRPELVVADEPSASLDGGSYVELVTQLRELVQAGSALLLATHDQRLLRDLDADVHVLQDGAFVRSKTEALPWPRAQLGKIGSVALLRVQGLRVAYGDRDVLEDVDFELHRGEVVALLGESGAGKTTLLRVLAGFRDGDDGEVEVPSRRAAVQLVCQDARGSMTPGRTLQSLLAEASAPFFDAAAGTSAVQLDESVLQRRPEQMSGGEQRRAVLLRALAVHPDVLLLDEPTASLDRAASVAVIRNLLQLQRSRALAMVVATHDEELAAAIAHRIVVLEGGRLCERG